jgi:alpha-L-rhamnosidase
MNEPRYLEVAQSLVPRLAKKVFRPVNQIKPRPDVAAFQGWTAQVIGPAGKFLERSFEQGDGFVLDFGEHLVGQVRLAMTDVDEVVDAPVRLKMIFAETLSELAEPLDPSPGWLCRSWIQDEVFNFDWLPQEFKLPRRYAFRYVKIHVLASPRKIRFTDISVQAVTSATFKPMPAPKAIQNDPELANIYKVGCRTLRDCMQTVFEDGPKRDRRLWLGDLRLQALCNYYTFRNFDLVKRCLYLFAALPYPNGLLSSCVYEYPQPVTGKNMIPDYAALFGPTLLDYANFSGDWATAADLWPVVLRQLELLRPLVTNDAMLWDSSEQTMGRWIFADWKEGLDKQATAQAEMIYCWKAMLALADRLGRQADVAGLADLVEKLTQAAREKLFDPATGLFVSGPNRQVSYSSNAWMVLAGVVSGPTAADVLTRLMACRDAVRPATPYTFHHFVEALYVAGLGEEALRQIRQYWGGMVRLGASTYWEIFDAANHTLSAYKDHHLNSYCHAWSCGPAYFLPKYEAGGSGQ